MRGHFTWFFLGKFLKPIQRIWVSMTQEKYNSYINTLHFNADPQTTKPLNLPGKRASSSMFSIWWMFQKNTQGYVYKFKKKF